MIIVLSATGFLAGIIHALSGPDHMAAIAPLALDANKRQWVLGLRWGMGHASGAIVVGLAAIALRGVIQVEMFSSFAEKMVGVALISIGLWGLWKVFISKTHFHEHQHGSSTTHIHIHIHDLRQPHDSSSAHNHTHVAFGTGMLHGLAGGSHILGVLPALALPSVTAAVIYLLSFGAGTILAMIGFASLLGATGGFFGGGRLAYRNLMGSFSALAIVIGSIWLVI